MKKNDIEHIREAYEFAREGSHPSHDFAWYAVDSQGLVGMFFTAGFGPVPVEMFACGWDIYLRGFEELESPLFGEPVTTIGYDRLGFYCYDHREWDSDFYDRIAVPEKPRLLTDFSSEVQAIIKDVRYKGNFAEEPSIDVVSSWNDVI